MPLVRIEILKGKTPEYRQTLLHQRLGIQPADVFIVLQEPPNENWGLAGRQRED